MELHERLNLCLLALESRYPACVIEINKTLLGGSDSWEEACGLDEMRDVLRHRAPHFLVAPARLVVDSAHSAIYLIESSEEKPAFWVYCGGCTPAQRARQQANHLVAI